MSPYQRGTMWWGRRRDASGAVHRVSLKTRDKATAQRMEAMLAVLADQHRWATLDAIGKGDLSLGECFAAFNRGEAAVLERELQDGTRTVDLSPLVEEWRKAMRAKGRPAAPQQAKYVTQVRRLIPSDRPFPKKDFTTATLSAFLHSLSAAGVTQPNRYQAAFAKFARFLIERGLLTHNPLSNVERTREAPPRVVALEPEDVQRLLDALPEHDRPWHALMAATGAEWGAIVAAKVRDFDPDGLTFRAKGTKRAHRDRVVMVRQGPQVGLLRGHWRRLDALPDAPLFPRLTGHRSALQRLQDAARALGLPKMRIHDWRHVFAVQAVRDGLPLYVIAHQLGHSNTIMVQKVYGRFDVTLRDLRGVEHSQNTNRDTLRALTRGNT